MYTTQVVELTDYSRVDMLGMRYKFVNLKYFGRAGAVRVPGGVRHHEPQLRGARGHRVGLLLAPLFNKERSLFQVLLDRGRLQGYKCMNLEHNLEIFDIRELTEGS